MYPPEKRGTLKKFKEINYMKEMHYSVKGKGEMG